MFLGVLDLGEGSARERLAHAFRSDVRFHPGLSLEIFATLYPIAAFNAEATELGLPIALELISVPAGG